MAWRAALGATLAAAGLVAAVSPLVAHLNTITSSYRGPPRLEPTRYQRNAHTSQSVRVDGDVYRYSYIFKDHLGREWRWRRRSGTNIL